MPDVRLFSRPCIAAYTSRAVFAGESPGAVRLAFIRVFLMARSSRLLYLLWLSGWVFSRALWAAEPESKSAAESPAAEREVSLEEPSGKYIRLLRDDQQRPIEMQTAVVRFVAPDEEREGLSVDLIAAVHIGEKSYYEALNEQFKKYDAMLYELVAPEGSTPPRSQPGANGRPAKRRSTNAVSGLQTAMKDMLALDFQLDHIDYTQKNFVHADMSPEQFAKSMSSRGESIWTIVLQAMGRSLAMQGKRGQPSEADLLLALFDKNRALALKRVLAEQFEDIEGAMSIFEGPDGSTLISERNKKALEVLKREIASGKKRMAIFYGGGHMPDMARRLVEDFKLEPQEEHWLTAWDLHPTAKKPKVKAKPGKEATPADDDPAADAE